MVHFFEINRKLRAKIHHSWMVFALIIVIIIPFFITITLLFKSQNILFNSNISEILFSNLWQPTNNKFGLLPFILSSLWVTVLALIISSPICLMAGIFLTQYGRKNFLQFMHPIIDILAGIPSVIYGVWGILLIVPLISKYIAPVFHVSTSGYCILSGAIVLSVMIIPFILNILIDVFQAVPTELKEASLSLGATKWETVKYVILKKSFPGVISAFGLGVSRAFGETIAVLMVVGNVVQSPKGIFQAGYPLPALIANNYGEMLSIPRYDAALMLAALVLFGIVLVFNLFSRTLIIKSEKRQ